MKTLRIQCEVQITSNMLSRISIFHGSSHIDRGDVYVQKSGKKGEVLMSCVSLYG